MNINQIKLYKTIYLVKYIFILEYYEGHDLADIKVVLLKIPTIYLKGK